MEPNVIYVGRMNPIHYVLAVQTQVSQGHKKIFIKARGSYISRAVDVAQITVNRFIKDYEIDDVQIGTDILKIDNIEKRVSTISICLYKQENDVENPEDRYRHEKVKR